MIEFDPEGFPYPRSGIELHDVDDTFTLERTGALGARGLLAFSSDENIGIAGPSDMDGWVVEYDPAPEGGRPTATEK